MNDADHDRSIWPWITSLEELKRLVMGLAPRPDDGSATWQELRDAASRAQEAAGREVARADNREVDGARQRLELYRRGASEIEAALLKQAHRFLKQPPSFAFDPIGVGGWLFAYGRPKPGAPRRPILHTTWEAGEPDWENWRLQVEGGQIYYGVKLLDLRRADDSVKVAVQADLAVGKPVRSASHRFSAAQVEAWYREYVEKWPKDQPFPSRDDDWRAARAKFGDSVPRNSVRNARAQYAPDEWKKRARPKGGRKTGR